MAGQHYGLDLLLCPPIQRNMQTLQQLAASCIKDDTAPYFDNLHELPMPVLEQLLSALSPHQLLTLEKKLNKVVDTTAAWKGLCDKLRYSNKRREPWEPPPPSISCGHQAQNYFRIQFLKHYVSTYLLPFLMHWPYDDPELRPTKKVFCTQSNHLYNGAALHRQGEFPPLTFESFLDHLITVVNHTDEISVRAATLQHIASHAQLIQALWPSLKVLRVLAVTDDSAPALFKILEELMSGGNLQSLILINARLNPISLDRLFSLCAGCQCCLACKSRTTPSKAGADTSGGSSVHCSILVNDSKDKLHSCEPGTCVEDSRVPLSSPVHRKQAFDRLGHSIGCHGPSHEMKVADTSMQIIGDNKSIAHCQYIEPSNKAKFDRSTENNEVSSDIEDSGLLTFSKMPSEASELDLYDEVLVGLSPLTDSDNSVLTPKSQGTSCMDDIGVSHKNISAGEWIEEHLERGPGYSFSCGLAHGIEALSLLSCESDSNTPVIPILPSLASWLPHWGALKHLVLQIDDDQGLGAASSVLLEKIHVGQLTGLVLSLGKSCIRGQQLFWDVLQVLASRHLPSNCRPMKQFAFSSVSPIPGRELCLPERIVAGLQSMCLWDTEFHDDWTVKNLSQFLAHDQSLRCLCLKHCHISSGQETLLSALNSRVPSLAQLELEGVDLSQVWTALCSLITNNPLLATLTLSDCGLTAQHVQTPDFAHIIQSLQHLRYLDLSHNRLSDILVHFVPAVVYPGSPIKTLNIGNTKLDQQGMHQLVDALLKAPADSMPLLDSLTVPGLYWGPDVSEQSSLLSRLQDIALSVDAEGDDYVSDYVAQM